MLFRSPSHSNVFTIFTFYPANLPNSLISYSSFLVTSLVFSMYNIMSLANSDSFTSSFPNCTLFISFFPLIAVARTSKTMLSKSGESGHPCLVHDLSGNAFRFLLLSMMDLIQIRWRSQKLFRQTKAKSIQHHQTSFTKNAKESSLRGEHKKRKRPTKTNPKQLRKW